MGKPRIACVVGTRPDAIKSAPVVLELRKQADKVDCLLLSTGQHREMLDQALGAFGLRADEDLNVMRHGQTLAEVAARCLEGLDRALADLSPDYVLAQGDTTSTLCAAMCAFFRRIPFGHIEAGLRTDSISLPFPEEFNRRATGLVATHHFAPTQWAAGNLLGEGKAPESVFVTGNTGIDAVLYVAENVGARQGREGERRIVLLTTHRRENWGEPQRRIACAAKALVEAVQDVELIVPMHKNPQVREVLSRVLGGHERVQLIEPPDYSGFVELMRSSTLILTDSGGVQEEAPAFGIPVLVLRESTERPEGVQAGTARLVGADEKRIVAEARALLEDLAEYRKMAHASCPYGDGKAAARIRWVVLRHLGVKSEEVPMWT
jgi:UDP-N-acetylglucosamine 2-epimerase (non-hydrolysing)